MKSEKEIFRLPKGFPFSLFHTGGRCDALPALHWHDCLELNLVKAGKGVNVISENNFEMEQGQIYVINSNERHYAFSDGSLDMLVIIFEPVYIWQNTSFDYEYLKPFFERNVNFHNLIDGNNPFAAQIISLLEDIEREYLDEKPGYRLFIKASLMKILALLYRHFKLEGQIGSELLEKQRDFERIREAVLYIEQHFTENICIPDLAKLIYMNASYFSTYFKKVMKMNITDYILTLRINRAAILLRETAKPVTEIAAESGFGNSAYFTRAFRKITKLSPTKYRSEMIQKKVKSI